MTIGTRRTRHSATIRRGRACGLLVLLTPLLLLPSTAFATWSVLAVDRGTGRVVLASASCVNANDETMKMLLAVVVPGKGVAACQAASDGTHANQMLVFNE